jgi:hypothetical protein
MSVIDEKYEMFCVERFPLPNEHMVQELESRINVIFPDSYRNYILRYNGGYFREPRILPGDNACPLDRLTFMYGIGSSHKTSELGRISSLSLWDNNDPPVIVPIGYTLMGNYIIIMTHLEDNGEIMLNTKEKSYFLANTIEEYFELLAAK